MAIVKGTVEAIASKKVGKGYAYSFLVDGEWYRHGFDKPKFEKGFMVQFDDTPHEYGVIDVSTLQFKKGTAVNNKSAGGVAKSAGKSSSQSENWEARAQYWDEKDKRDIVKDIQYNYRSAFHMAAELVQFGVDKELIKLRKTKSWEAFLTMIDGLAADLHAQFLAADTAPSVAENEEPVDDQDDEPRGDEPEGSGAAKDDDWSDLEDEEDWMN